MISDDFTGLRGTGLVECCSPAGSRGLPKKKSSPDAILPLQGVEPPIFHISIELFYLTYRNMVKT
jgi:hypothetical protein